MRFKFVLNTEEYGSMVLTEEPGGWKDIQVMLKRSLEYHGIFYEVMAQLEFKCRSGKEYIDKVIDELGIDAVIGITIYISCATTSGTVFAPDYSIDYSDDYGSNIAGSGDPVFETLYEGVINLANYKQTSESTTVDLIQSDFVQKVINRFATKVNIDKDEDLDGNPLDPTVANPFSLIVPAKALIFEADYEYINTSETLQMIFPLDVVVIELPVILNRDDIGGGVSNSSPYIYTSQRSGNPQGIQEVEPIWVNNTGGDVTFIMNYNFVGNLQIANDVLSTIDFSVLFQIGGTQFSFAGYPFNPYFYEVNKIDDIPLLANVTLTIPINVNDTISVTIPSGEKLFLIFRVADVEGSNVTPRFFDLLSFNFTDFELKLTQESITSPSTADAYLIHELGAAISQRITGLPSPFNSQLFGRKNSLPVSYPENGCASFCAITNGKKLRNFPEEARNLFISMSDFYKSVNSIWNTGLGIQGTGVNTKLVMEEKSFFYSTDVILQCPKASNIKVSVAKEYYISDIIIGYDKWENEEVNGIDEFNSKREYNTGIKSIDNKKDYLSVLLASAFAIEFTRRKQYLSNPTLDYKYDNDNFIFAVKRTVDGNGIPTQLNDVEKTENYDIVNNIISPETIYNLRLSPARSLLRHLSEIGGSLLKYAGRAIKFTYGEGNYLAETKFTADTCPGNFNNELLKENQDIVWDQAGEPPIWIPEYIEFDYPISFSQYLDLKNNPTKSIEVSEGSSGFMKGFIVSVFYKPVGGIATFKLLKAYVN